MSMTIAWIFLLILFIACWFDIKFRIIPNKLILFGFIFGSFLRILTGEPVYIGYAVGLLIILLLVLGKIVGGGDIKLLSLLPLYINQVGYYFLVLSIVYLVYFVTRKEHKKGVAFAPVIAAAYLIFLVITFVVTFI